MRDGFAVIAGVLAWVGVLTIKVRVRSTGPCVRYGYCAQTHRSASVLAVSSEYLGVQAARLCQTLPRTCAARSVTGTSWGHMAGEEFVMLFLATDVEDACAALHRLRESDCSPPLCRLPSARG